MYILSEIIPNILVGKLYRNHSVAWTKIKPIKMYLTTIQINRGKKKEDNGENTLSTRKVCKKKKKKIPSSSRACSFDMSRREATGFKERLTNEDITHWIDAFYPLLEPQVAHCISISSPPPHCSHTHHLLSKNSVLHTKLNAKVDITDLWKGTCS